MAIITKPSSKSAYWGVKPLAGDTYENARITKMEVGDEGSIEPLPNSEGETTGLCGYDRKRPVSLEIIIDAAVTIPEFMDDIVVLGLTVNVEKPKQLWEYKGWQKVSIEGTCYPNLEADDVSATAGTLTAQNPHAPRKPIRAAKKALAPAPALSPSNGPAAAVPAK